MSAAIKQVAVKERPILMHARSIRGILERRKSQTRRIVKGLPSNDGAFIIAEMSDGVLWPHASYDGEAFDDGTGCERPIASPYGLRGDRLWVRETFYCDDFRYPDGPIEEFRKMLYYRADVPSGRFQDADY